ncbi:MAG: flagellar biosynthetic protein FliO [Desulfarculales bacterium]|jgi:flagellar protein FliO/FliZ|nr:flagellar biosynthetic protein FliO [Desulfarculales bacterium]
MRWRLLAIGLGPVLPGAAGAAETAGAEAPSFSLAFIQMIMALAVVLALLLLLYWLLRRFNPGRILPVSPGGMKIWGRLALGGRKSVLMLEAGRQLLILGVSEKDITLLRRIADKEEIQEIKDKNEFGFKKFMKKAGYGKEREK